MDYSAFVVCFCTSFFTSDHISFKNREIGFKQEQARDLFMSAVELPFTKDGFLLLPTAFRSEEKEEGVEKWRILLGKHSINHAESTESVYHVKRIYQHEQFRYPHLNELDYDTALVKPVEDIVTNHFIHYACLPKRDSFLRPGHFCWVTGWGDTQGGNKNLTLSRVLNQAKLPVIDFNTCRLQKFWGHRVRQSMICAGFRDAGGPPAACQGDSGGPLVCQTGGEKWEVHGVVSFGPIGCKAENKPSVFTRTSAFISWIEAIRIQDHFL
ncbi:PREDICTED: elastase-1-like [Gavialis gangeticus]|uniref:elastase-1-like n=1 Tax=Gavialis gangeticus TaxID=94835 RepID=UPI00092EFEF3|nr:PREDICTED: elastase-1-like [Gavialis gangeticus]